MLARRLLSKMVPIRVHNILVKGNTKTKDWVIEAELKRIKSATTMQDLMRACEGKAENIYDPQKEAVMTVVVMAAVILVVEDESGVEEGFGWCPVPNAYTLAISGKRPFVVIHTSLVELLTRAKLQFTSQALRCTTQQEHNKEERTHLPESSASMEEQREATTAEQRGLEKLRRAWQSRGIPATKEKEERSTTNGRRTRTVATGRGGGCGGQT
ncbi:hypothetical protein HN873_019694, partial [Arachis hypogaea]